MTKRRTLVTKQKDITRAWHLVDLHGQILGRTATVISGLLTGKSKPNFTANLDCGDWVVAINARGVKLSGSKEQKKVYRWHTGYPGGFRERSWERMMDKFPEKAVRLAVSGMLAKNKLRSQRLARLKIFPDSNHPYADKFSKLVQLA